MVYIYLLEMDHCQIEDFDSVLLNSEIVQGGFIHFSYWVFWKSSLTGFQHIWVMSIWWYYCHSTLKLGSHVHILQFFLYQHNYQIFERSPWWLYVHNPCFFISGFWNWLYKYISIDIDSVLKWHRIPCFYCRQSCLISISFPPCYPLMWFLYKIQIFFFSEYWIPKLAFQWVDLNLHQWK